MLIFIHHTTLDSVFTEISTTPNLRGLPLTESFSFSLILNLFTSSTGMLKPCLHPYSALTLHLYLYYQCLLFDATSTFSTSLASVCSLTCSKAAYWYLPAPGCLTRSVQNEQRTVLRENRGNSKQIQILLAKYQTVLAFFSLLFLPVRRSKINVSIYDPHKWSFSMQLPSALQHLTFVCATLH